MLIVFASPFRILVTFAIVLEVRGISFFQYHEPIWQKFLVEPKYHNRVLFDEFSILCCYSASSTFLQGLSGRNLLNLVRHANPCIHNSENHMFLELSLFSCIPTPIYRLIVRSSCATCSSMPVILVVRQAILFQSD